jgi:hypothetical protein
MENVFEQILADSTTADAQAGATTASTNSNVPELGSEYDLDFTTDETEDTADYAEDTAELTDSEDVESTQSVQATVETPTNQAFAQMRVQNKELSEKLNALDAIAKASGLKDVDDLIAKSKEAQIRKQAQADGIPEAVAKELAEMREFIEQSKQRDIQQAYQAKEQAFVGNLNDFIKTNNLSDKSVQQLSDNLTKDGFSNDYLMGLPKAALNRILSSYIGTNPQKNLERKDAIRNELPLNQASSKVSNETVLKQIDDLARQLAGK